jgi:hypothetical protein
MIERVEAVELVRRMRGGSQSQLVRCSNGHYYVVKFQNNPQGKRVLVNELIATLLAKHLGLPVGEIAIVNVRDFLIRYTEDAVVQLERSQIPYQCGSCFGSRLIGDIDRQGYLCHGVLPDFVRGLISNLRDFLGMLVFDTWTSNIDNRQAVLMRNAEDDRLVAVMIDNGDCFNRSKWTFPDCSTRGLVCGVQVYHHVESIDDFEPWLSRLEHETDISLLRKIGDMVPEEWCDGEKDFLDQLLIELGDRCRIVRSLLLCTLRYRPNDFPRLRSSRTERLALPLFPVNGFNDYRARPTVRRSIAKARLT